MELREILTDRELAQLEILRLYLLRKEQARSPKGRRRRADCAGVVPGQPTRVTPPTERSSVPILQGKFYRGPKAKAG